MGLFFIYTSALVKCLLLTITHFLIGMVVYFSTVEFSVFFIYCRCGSFIEYVVYRYFSQSAAYLFIVLTRSAFHRTKVFNFDELQCADFFLVWIVHI